MRQMIEKICEKCYYSDISSLGEIMRKKLFLNFVFTFILGCETKMLLDGSIIWFLLFLESKMMLIIPLVQRFKNFSRPWL